MDQKTVNEAPLKPIPVNRVLNPTQVAAYLGVGRTKVYELMHQKDFPGWRIGDRYKVSEIALNEWIAKQPGKREVK